MNDTVMINMTKFGNKYESWNDIPVLLNQQSLANAEAWINQLAVSF